MCDNKDLLEGIDGSISQVTGDGAYEAHHCHTSVQRTGAKPIFPPRKGARIQQHGNCHAPPKPRDEAIRDIRSVGRKTWKENNNYHRRSIAETAMFRVKKITGSSLASRKFDSQSVELFLRCSILNKMTTLGMPKYINAA